MTGLDFKRYEMWDDRLWCDRCESPVTVGVEGGPGITVWQAINDSVEHERTVHGGAG